MHRMVKHLTDAVVDNEPIDWDAVNRTIDLIKPLNSEERKIIQALRIIDSIQKLELKDEP